MTVSPLVVVSNRLPFEAQRRNGQIVFTRSPGGVATALDAALEQAGGCWIGWSGLPEEEMREAGQPEIPAESGRRYMPVPLSRREVQPVLRPILQSDPLARLPLFPRSCSPRRRAWSTYDRVNAGSRRSWPARPARRAGLDPRLSALPRAASSPSAPARSPHRVFPPYPLSRPRTFFGPSPGVGRCFAAFSPRTTSASTPAYSPRHLFASSERLFGCETDREGDSSISRAGR